MPNKEEKIYLTADSFKQYQERLQYLQEVLRPQVIEEIKEARNQGDLSENAEYDAARDKQATIENEITEIQHILDNYEIIKTQTNRQVSVVRIGSNVSVVSLKDDTVINFQIVGALDTDPFNGKISNTSPLAKAVIGRKAGEVVEVEAPNKYQVKIVHVG
ncbi:transcription elongation factor [Metamycoplasma arthritidis]|uniref:Transcription elongation factor GreA n=1 Tax=Metamycoplasma arthritidis (strain 158L3-1) TaxID=243272 RepID=GREA_META1|nr:transcription elongation factor GreA [Metamycoplasma arthritidis]B3PM73.1 RecName: Full=Transcription elongation factor GreA; AltName: Full=Transcript cleavage factor GreA [Metamycoplasma arthritidis 158L3-1]ACF07125.1 transcription elongation factor [Metamycoplasma arthritidis 158L3-1]VEU78651.1 transcription elongation factor [Metamycoplasma arthritidis]